MYHVKCRLKVFALLIKLENCSFFLEKYSDQRVKSSQNILNFVILPVIPEIGQTCVILNWTPYIITSLDIVHS